MYLVIKSLREAIKWTLSKKNILTLILNMANNEIINYEKAQAKEWNMTDKEWKNYEKVQAKE